MTEDDAEDTSTEALAAAFLAGEGLARVSTGEGGHHHDDAGAGSTSVRELDYRGRHIRIETTYRITIDGEPLRGHVEVLPSGQVHYHRFPQYAPRSAVDVAKTVVDTVWDRPAVPDELGGEPQDGHGDHDHGGAS